MPENDKKQQQDAERQRRLAQALRANLQRRKAQGRARAERIPEDGDAAAGAENDETRR